MPVIYFAGPLFTAAERAFNLELERRLAGEGFTVFLPQRECDGLSEPERIFRKCLEGIDCADVVTAILDGTDADSGTAWEAGYAFARGIPVVGVRTDFRERGDDGGLNLMLSRSCRAFVAAPSIEGHSMDVVAQMIISEIRKALA